MDCVSLGILVDQLIDQINTLFGPMAIVKTDTRIGQELQSQGHWDITDVVESVRAFQRHWTGSTCKILDVGANVGSWTLPIARRFPQNHIHAFECQEILSECFNRMLDLNNINNVTMHQCAVSDENSVIEFASIDYDMGGNLGAFELEPVKNSDFNGFRLNNQVTKINTCTVDSFNFEQVGLIKIDAEGMEHKIIKGAVNTLQRCKSVVLFENHKTDLNEILKIFDLIKYQIVGQFGQMSCAISKLR
jgi:FkbM family methyltransferase